jgi:hypothetical protein
MWLTCAAITVGLAGCWRGEAPSAPPPPPPPPADAARVDVPVGPLTPNAVLDRVSESYRAHIRRCYTLALKKSPGLTGKVLLTFTVDGTGHVVDPRAERVPPELASCITAKMQGWLFPPARDDAGGPGEATFTIPVALVSE